MPKNLRLLRTCRTFTKISVPHQTKLEHFKYMGPDCTFYPRAPKGLALGLDISILVKDIRHRAHCLTIFSGAYAQVSAWDGLRNGP